MTIIENFKDEVVTPETVETMMKHIGDFLVAVGQAPAKSKVRAEFKVRSQVIASHLVLGVSKGIKDGTLTTDTHNILSAQIKPSDFELDNIPPKYLGLLNNEIRAEVAKIKKESVETLSEVEEAAILDDQETVVAVSPVEGETITIDKKKGTITLFVEKTGQRISKNIKDFRSKSWREIATGIIQFIKDQFKKVKSYVFDKPISAVKSLFKRNKTIADAQPTPQPS